MLHIKEIIVVEGRNDERAIKQAVSAEVIVTSGYHIPKEVFDRIALARETQGVIVFTDPDYPGEQIRKRINERIKGCKNAYLTQKEAFYKNDIGIENASAAHIMDALMKAQCEVIATHPVFTRSDLSAHGLSGGVDSAERRAALGRILGIGYANAKQLENRLNAYGITREAFLQALHQINKDHPEESSPLPET